MSLNDYLDYIIKPTIGVTGIYSLSDPLEGRVMYVGKASCIYTRYKQHVGCLGGTAKDKWISELLSKGHQPSVDILEVCPPEYLNEREKFWIDKHFGNGEKTVNTAKVNKSVFGGTTRFQVAIGVDTTILMNSLSIMMGETVSSIVENLVWDELQKNHSDSLDAVRNIFAKRGLDFDAILKARTGK